MFFLKENCIHNCIIIGSGPSGYSAAIYAARYGLNPILFSGPNPGGQLTYTNDIENYLGFPESIDGISFMDNCKKQALRFNTKILNKTINKVILSNDIGGTHRVFFGKSQDYLDSIGIIIATGSSSSFLGIKKEKELVGLGISFCATCDGFFHKEKDVAVVGGGDSALEETLYLSKICKKVYLLVRKNYLKASKILQKKVFEKKNVEINFSSIVTEIIGNDFLEGIKIFEKKNKTIRTVLLSGLFVAIGHIPNTDIFKNQINLDNKGYIIVKKGSTITNKPGVFAAGDVMDINYRQAITSASTGCMAAIDLDKYLSSL
ncbi:thioredoxin-disulfide reductase [Blattabacterium cuenoti]|uniref:thioredoxin-disulfide reductase n=1 Tax=Blattabacterium cuenoti TaxID=1653831 RepID=UPI00163C85DF|nr:thioredoxin-disulfide reductase [Blattabacterium cuenoti]